MLSNGVIWTKSEVKEHLLQMFPTLADVKVDEVKSFTESYHKYKREYVKHLSFNPEDENLSKCVILRLIIFICFQLLCWSMGH